jgi:hypothetical protein
VLLAVVDSELRILDPYKSSHVTVDHMFLGGSHHIASADLLYADKSWSVFWYDPAMKAIRTTYLLGNSHNSPNTSVSIVPSPTSLSVTVIHFGYFNVSGNEFQVSDVVDLKGIAVDWVTKKIYWTEGSKGNIVVSQLDGRMRTTLIHTGMQPLDIVLHPKAG